MLYFKVPRSPGNHSIMTANGLKPMRLGRWWLVARLEKRGNSYFVPTHVAKINRARLVCDLLELTVPAEAEVVIWLDGKGKAVATDFANREGKNIEMCLASGGIVVHSQGVNYTAVTVCVVNVDPNRARIARKKLTGLKHADLDPRVRALVDEARERLGILVGGPESTMRGHGGRERK